MYVVLIRHFRLLMINRHKFNTNCYRCDGQFVTRSHLVEEMHLACVIDIYDDWFAMTCIFSQKS
jgi:hypothetical protein